MRRLPRLLAVLAVLTASLATAVVHSVAGVALRAFAPILPRRSVTRITLAIMLVAGLLATPLVPAQAQVGVEFYPATGGIYQTGTQLAMQVSFCANPENGYVTHWVTVNSVDHTSDFPISGYGWQTGCVWFGGSSGTLTLASGQNVIEAGIRVYYFDGADVYYETTYTNTITHTGLDASAVPGILLAPHNGHNRSVTQCEVSCFNLVTSYSTPAYVSLDQPRAVTLVYSSGQVGDRHTVQVDAANQAWNTPDKMSIRLQRSNGSYVTFTNGSTELFFAGIARLTTQRLAAQFSDTTLATGAYNHTVIVRSYFSGTPYDATAPLRLLVLNERASPYGAGWQVAGAARLRFGPGDSLTLTDGAGSIQFWMRASCTSDWESISCTYTPPAGEFGTLQYCYGGSCGGMLPYSYRQAEGTSLLFDGLGRLGQVMDPFGNTVQYMWRDSVRLDSIVDPAGKAIIFAYTSNRLSSITDRPGSRTTSVSINGANDLTQVQDPVGGYPFQSASYSAHRLISRTDRRGGAWRAAYDFAGHIARDSTPTVQVDTDGAVSLVTIYRSPAAAVLIDPASGQGTSGNPASARTDSGGIGTVRPPLGATRKVRLDAYGAVLEVLSPAHEFVRFTRNTHGQPLTMADSTGSWAYTWDGPRLTRRDNAITGTYLINQWNTTWNRVTYSAGSEAQQIVINYYNSANGRLDSTRLAGQPVTRFYYDSRGRDTSTADPWGHVTRVRRDATSFLNADTVIAGVRRTITRYDGLGRAVRVLGPTGASDSTDYDVLNRVVRRVGALNDTTRIVYQDSVTQITDAIGQTYRYLTNAVGWDTAIVDPRNKTDRYVRDRAGRVVRWTNRRNQTTTFVYDSLGRLMGRGLSDTSRVRSFEHHPSFLAASDRAGADVVSDTLRSVQDTSYAISVRNGVPYYVRSRYERTNWQLRVAVWNGTHSELETAYQLDSLGRSRAIVPPSASTDSMAYSAEGTLTTTKLHGAVNLTHAYRPRHDLARLTHSVSGIETAFGREFVHDTLGRVVEARDSNRTRFERYGYDALGRLTSFARRLTSSACAATDTTSELGMLCTTGSTTVDTAGFSYDLVGNRTGSGATVDSANRQTAWGGFTMTYDDDGNLTRKYQAGVLDQYFYWNSANELDSVRTSRQGGAWQTVRFRYDASGRRAQKVVGSDVTNYVWDGDHVVAEYRGDGTILWQYTYYAGTDRPHSVWGNDGTRRYFTSDGRGNVTGLVDSTGTVVAARYRYLPFGDAAAVVGGGANVRFAGRELDTETGLYYNRARYYDPQAGRFISQDPIGLDGGINPYTFAGNDPVNARDPSGTRCVWRQEPQMHVRGLASAGDEEGRWYLECTDPIGVSFGGWSPLWASWQTANVWLSSAWAGDASVASGGHRWALGDASSDLANLAASGVCGEGILRKLLPGSRLMRSLVAVRAVGVVFFLLFPTTMGDATLSALPATPPGVGTPRKLPSPPGGSAPPPGAPPAGGPYPPNPCK